ncbi:MAG: RelA/SpoT family protein [candidate division Zixibacteria bacterium]|nr:RelA/SpoT family protein [candidate division Zixibacteria bacterium]
MNANIDIRLVRKAYEFAENAHSKQKRQSGDPFLSHCLEVAFILAEQHMDSTTIAAGLLHDVIEDTPATSGQIKNEFGDEIAYLLDGLTKIKGIRYGNYLESQANYYRKMILAMAEDIRVVIIKLADRLHNMRTLEYLPEEKRLLIAKETREVYAPLAHRLGMSRVKIELEDLVLKYLEPDIFYEMENNFNLSKRGREAYIRQVVNPLYRELYKAGINAEITGRAKHYESIHRKMKKRSLPFEEIYDLLAIRILVDTIEDCYHALGIVHKMWQPVAERLHDYIAAPKSNMYQSLHTTVIGPENRRVEIQIRTHMMHRTAEYGIAAHWLYKEGKKAPDEHDKRMAWIREILEWQKEMTNPEEFLEYLKIDLFTDDIFVYTPMGDIKQLPKGATAIDFAFAIHTDIGYRCSGVKINGKVKSLSTELRNGDEAEIITSQQAHPTNDWLKLVRTTKAKNKIRRWLFLQGFEQSVEIGKGILERELKKNYRELPPENELLDIAMSFSLQDVPSLFAAIANGKVSYQSVLTKISPPEKTKQKQAPVVSDFVEHARKVSKGIKVQGMDSMVFHFAKCCQPVPGDNIIGYITRGRGISVHRSDCHNVANLLDDPERRIEVEWDVHKDMAFMVKLNLLVEDRKNIIKDITEAVASVDINVRGAELHSLEPHAKCSMVIEVQNINQMNKAIKRLKNVKGVIEVERGSSLHFDDFDANKI